MDKFKVEHGVRHQAHKTSDQTVCSAPENVTHYLTHFHWIALVCLNRESRAWKAASATR